MYNLVIGICFLVLLAYLSFYSKNDKFDVSVKYNLDGESEESESDLSSNVSSNVTSNVTGSNVTGGNVTGGNVTGGNVTGGNVTGGNVTGGNKCKEVNSGGLHILMHHIKGVANIFSPEIKIDA